MRAVVCCGWGLTVARCWHEWVLPGAVYDEWAVFHRCKCGLACRRGAGCRGWRWWWRSRRRWRRGRWSAPVNRGFAIRHMGGPGWRRWGRRECRRVERVGGRERRCFVVRERHRNRWQWWRRRDCGDAFLGRMWRRRRNGLERCCWQTGFQWCGGGRIHEQRRGIRWRWWRHGIGGNAVLHNQPQRWLRCHLPAAIRSGCRGVCGRRRRRRRRWRLLRWDEQWRWHRGRRGRCWSFREYGGWRRRWRRIFLRSGVGGRWGLWCHLRLVPGHRARRDATGLLLPARGVLARGCSLPPWIPLSWR
jgi:hypothetical protein